MRLLSMMFLILFALKLCHLVDLNWFYVVAPLIVQAGIWIVLIILAIIGSVTK